MLSKQFKLLRYPQMVLFIYIIFALALVGCDVSPIPVSPSILYVDSSREAQPILILDHALHLQAGLASAAIPETAVEGQFMIAEWRSPRVAKSPYEFARFSYLVERTCQVLPQGDNLTVRYELYNEAGAIVKQDEMKVSIRTCPPGAP